MTHHQPDDVGSRLHAEGPMPSVDPRFFETLAVTAASSTPTTPPRWPGRLSTSKLTAILAGALVLGSGAAYAGGLMGGGDDGPEVAAIAATHGQAQNPQRHPDADRSAPRARHEPDRSAPTADGDRVGDPATPPTTTPKPSAGTDSGGPQWKRCGDEDWWENGVHEWWKHQDEPWRAWHRTTWCGEPGPWGDHDWGDHDWGDHDRDADDGAPDGAWHDDGDDHGW
jgi:hypothetical protein